MATRVVAIPIFGDVEVRDFCGPFEVFSVARRFDPAVEQQADEDDEAPGTDAQEEEVATSYGG